MKHVLLLSFISLFTFSCVDQYDEDIVQVVGIYDANVVGISGPHPISVSVDFGSKIFIDAPFDGFEWLVVNARVRNKEEDLKEIEIFNQELGPDVYLSGSGVYYNYSIQLDYVIEYGGEVIEYSIIGTKR